MPSERSDGVSEEQVSYSGRLAANPRGVYVEDGVIKRMRPIIFDESDAASWTIEVRGKK